MSKLLLQLRAVSSELRRRKVVRVVIAYLVAAAAIIGVVSDVGPALDLPEHTLTVIVALLVIGLPLAAFLAWVYELVPDQGAGAEPGPAGEAAGTTAAAVGAAAAGMAGPGDDRERASLSAAAHAGRPAESLPTPATPFIGRDAELARLTALLTAGEGRLVTVLGPGGVGKTRLAIRAAQLAAPRFRDGAAFVPLSGLPDGTLLPQAVAEALGITPARNDDALGEVLSFLREKQLLLVLDTFEHLIAAAGFIEAILEGAPAVRALVTSRERLNLEAETLLPLDGLRISPASDGADGDALRLFVAVARRNSPGFELDAASRPCATRLCEILAGAPLAIELAAAWTRILTCGEILAEVQHDLDILASESAAAPERHRSLGATFDASWRLLPDRERTALARIAVFAGPFEREAAAAVAGADLPLLRALVDKSFLAPVHGRFHMLHVLRQYARKRLEAEPAAAVSARMAHATWFAGRLQALEPQLLRSEPEAVTSVARSIADVRAAWGFACTSRDADTLLVAMNGLFHFFEARGWSREGADTFARAATALENGGGAADGADGADGLDADTRLEATRGRLAVRRGALLERLGELIEAEALLRRGLRGAERLRDEAEIAFALGRLGRMLWSAGAYDEAAARLNAARALYEKLGDRHGVGLAVAHLGNVALTRGEHDLAAELYAEALEILRREHDRNGMCVALNNLGYIAIHHRRFDEARRNLGEALALQAVLGNQRSAAYLLNNLGYAAREAGDSTEAVQHFREALAVSDRLGFRSMAASSLTGLAELHVRAGELETAAPLLRRALSIATGIGDQRVALEALLTLARLHERGQDAVTALWLARYVHTHAATPADTRVEAGALLGRLDGERAGVQEPDRDLAGVVAEVLARDPAPSPHDSPAPPAMRRVGAFPERG